MQLSHVIASVRPIGARVTGRRLRRTLATAGVALAAAGAGAATAAAEPHRLRIELTTGGQLELTVDVPPGTPLADVKLPALPAPARRVVDLGPATTPGSDASAQEQPGDDEPARGDDGRGQGKAGETRGNRGAGSGALATPTPTPTPTATATPAPAPAPTATATPAPAAPAVGIPNLLLERFEIPPFLLPIYQAAGVEYGVRWEVLAAINEIETGYGRNLNVSTAGAVGWMQFLPSTWKDYGLDANRDGYADPYNPVDAIFSAARYLRAAGADRDLRAAIFAYNHADWYVNSVVERARVIGALPQAFVGALTGLSEGRFPVHARARYAGALTPSRARKGRTASSGSSTRRGIRISARRGAPVVAVNDGRIVRVGRSRRLGRFVQLQDVYGNTYTYGRLRSVARSYPEPAPAKVSREAVLRELDLPAPGKPASRTSKAASRRAARPAASKAAPAKERLFANPGRKGARALPTERRATGPGAYVPSEGIYGAGRSDLVRRPLRRGARVAAGTVLGRLGGAAVLFEVRPAGRKAPRIDPKPILDGWRLLESTAVYRAEGGAFDRGARPSVGQVLLMDEASLRRLVLDDDRIELYACGRADVRAGRVDRRVLATLAFLAASGLNPTVTSLRCGHSRLTSSGNVSHHFTGDAVDIAAINGTPILGHQGPGSITEQTVQRLLTLQGTLKPAQIISLMEFRGTDNTLAMGDHDDHIHVGWRPRFGDNAAAARAAASALRPSQWAALVERLGALRNPSVRLRPSAHAIRKVARAARGG
jgi:hypothetical protein